MHANVPVATQAICLVEGGSSGREMQPCTSDPTEELFVSGRAPCPIYMQHIEMRCGVIAPIGNKYAEKAGFRTDVGKTQSTPVHL